MLTTASALVYKLLQQHFKSVEVVLISYSKDLLFVEYNYITKSNWGHFGPLSIINLFKIILDFIVLFAD